MVIKPVEVVNKLGLHARASSKLVQLASTFKCDIYIERNGRKANAKSIMSLMMLAASKGSFINISCSGEDEVVALEQIMSLFESRFGEYE